MTIAEYRKLTGLTQQELAALVGVSKSFLSEIESGCSCSLQTALKIQRATKGAVCPADLLREAAPQ